MAELEVSCMVGAVHGRDGNELGKIRQTKRLE
jgi:hypothetical protein